MFATEKPPGLLLVTTTLPAGGIDGESNTDFEASYHEWYNNEHGPARLRIDSVTGGWRWRDVTSCYQPDHECHSRHTANSWKPHTRRGVESQAGSSRAKPQKSREFLALYDFADPSMLWSTEYEDLRRPENKSSREKDVMARLDIQREIFVHLATDSRRSTPSHGLTYWNDGPEFDVNQSCLGTYSSGRILLLLERSVWSIPEIDTSDQEAFHSKPSRINVDEWYAACRLPDVASLRGWRRSRRFWRITKIIDQSQSQDRQASKGVEHSPYITRDLTAHQIRPVAEYLTLHEFGLIPESMPESTLELGALLDVGPGDQALEELPKYSTGGKLELLDWESKVYSHHYTLGPAPRYLSPSDKSPFVSPAHITPQTKIAIVTGENHQWRRIESIIDLKDGTKIPYCLEGSIDPSAPLIVLCNSILVDHGIWDSFVEEFFSENANCRFRILRYNARGRSKLELTMVVNLARLADDIVGLLDALREPRAAAIIGVSLGGATSMQFAVRHPDRVAMIVACDTNAATPSGSEDAWRSRIAVADAEAGESSNAEDAVVGETLADQTVRRWFPASSFDGGEIETKIDVVRQAIRANSLQGFKDVVQALWYYDLREAIQACSVPAAFIVGSEDAKLPGAMQELPLLFGRRVPSGTLDSMDAGQTPRRRRLQIVEGAGHLPMVDKTRSFSEIIGNILR